MSVYIYIESNSILYKNKYTLYISIILSSVCMVLLYIKKFFYAEKFLQLYAPECYLIVHQI